MNILPAIKTHLTNAGIATTIKLNNFSDTPVEQVMIRDTGEVEPDATATFTTDIEYRTFQIMVKGANYSTVADTCHAIREALHGRHALTVGGFKFLNIDMFSGFQPITNEIGNYEFSGNFKARVIDV